MLLILGLFKLIIYIAETPKRVELRKQQEKYTQAEKAYQKCLDKVANLTTWESQTYYFLDAPITITEGVNKYFDEWKAAGRPYYDMKKGYWEIGFMKWMMENYSSFCEEFNPDLIKYFLDMKIQAINP